MKKLREYQGVTHRDEVWWYEGVGYDSAIHLLHLADWGTDDDHAALMDLKAQPYEPTPTLEQIIEAAADHAYLAGRGLARDWKGTHALSLNMADAIRYAFPQIDAPLTAADHIAALVAMGAKLSSAYDLAHDADVLILPPEMTP